MKVSLLLRDRAFDWKKKVDENVANCFNDFKMEVVLDSMARDDKFIYNCCQQVLMQGLTTEEDIYYRQELIKDSIYNQSLIRDIYKITEVATEEVAMNNSYVLVNDFPSVVLDNSIAKLKGYMGKLCEIRDKLMERKMAFFAQGFRNLIRSIQMEITPEFVSQVEQMLEKLSHVENVSMNATIGVGYKATNYTICNDGTSTSTTSSNTAGFGGNMKAKLFKSNQQQPNRVQLDTTDTKAISDLLDLKQRGLESTADTLASVVDEINQFFLDLHKQLAFYCGCLNLYETLYDLDCRVQFPKPYSGSENRLEFRELYDVGLALSQKKRVVGNTKDMNRKDLTIITGANQGGKSTFLRSVGIGLIMFQAGMYVGAELFESSIYQGIYTHFRKDEDMELNRGKLDDELKRFSQIVDSIQPNSILMCNESFSSTNEREGSDVAIPVLNAMLEHNVRVFFVTHFYTIPRYYQKSEFGEKTMILQAERNEDSTRSFKLVEKNLMETSYAIDLYNHIFEEDTKEE